MRSTALTSYVVAVAFLAAGCRTTAAGTEPAPDTPAHPQAAEAPRPDVGGGLRAALEAATPGENDDSAPDTVRGEERGDHHGLHFTEGKQHGR